VKTSIYFLLVCVSVWGFQGVDPAQKSKDVPKQQPGTASPDTNQGQAPAPKSKGDSQKSEDVPEQSPGSNNPDLGKRHSPSNNKKKSPKKRTPAKNTDTAK
jgi:hypothetical protein